nr:uncharacterized protein LOC123478604 [Desmodus rotundus]
MSIDTSILHLILKLISGPLPPEQHNELADVQNNSARLFCAAILMEVNVSGFVDHLLDAPCVCWNRSQKVHLGPPWGKGCFVSTQKSPWTDCKLHCSSWGSNVVKLNADTEMDFVKTFSKMLCSEHLEKLWISLYYNGSQLKWAWLDGSASTLHRLPLKKADTASNHHKCVRDGQLLDGDCQECGYCIRKKTVYGDGIIHMWGIKLKTTHKNKKTKLIDVDNG